MDTIVFQTGQGCDSLVISTWALQPSSQSTNLKTTCDPFEVGVDTLWLQNQYGCDSLVITATSLLPSHTHPSDIFPATPQAGLDACSDQSSTAAIVPSTSNGHIFWRSIKTNQTLICGAGLNYIDPLVATGPCDSLFITRYV